MVIRNPLGKFHPQALFRGRDEACCYREGWVTGLGHVQDVVPSGDSRAWLFLVSPGGRIRSGVATMYLLLAHASVLLAKDRPPQAFFLSFLFFSLILLHFQIGGGDISPRAQAKI